MSDAKNLLEDQLETSHRRIASVHDLEKSLARCKQQLQDMTAVRVRTHIASRWCSSWLFMSESWAENPHQTCFVRCINLTHNIMTVHH